MYFRNMHQVLCGGESGLCDAMRPVSGPTLLHYLREVRFVGTNFHCFDVNHSEPDGW